MAERERQDGGVRARAEALAAPMSAWLADPSSLPSRIERLLLAAQDAGVGLDDAVIATLAPLLACEAPAARLAQRPRLARWLATTPWIEQEKSATLMDRELSMRLAAVSTEADLLRVLRRYRHRELLRIALRDFTRRASVRVLTREISTLADALLSAALRFLDRAIAARTGVSLAGRFCVLAMGKLGGREVNYSSDVDVLFVIDDAGDDAADPKWRAQAGEVARGIIRVLSVPTADGFAFRVDANLRPYGRDGPLVAGVDELERYYERAGQTWERAALIKARPCAGNIDLGWQVIERLRPFVWRRALDHGAVAALAAMKAKIDRQRVGRQDDVKLGRGGIREIEFFVQALQLLQGGRHPPVRVRGTLDALDALVFAGLLPSADRDALADAYVLLRNVEHRLQLPQDRQTQQLPADRDHDAWEALARRLGTTEVNAFRAALARHRDEVHARFADLLAAAGGGRPASVDAELALSHEAPLAAREEALARLGFGDPVAALAEVRRMSAISDGPFGARTRERHPTLAGTLLDEIAGSPAPDDALARIGDLRPQLWEPAAMSSLLAEHPATARMLVLLFATSGALARDFALHPELLDALVRSDAAALRRDRATLAAEVRARLEGLPVEDALERLRQVKHEEALRIGLHDLAGRLDLASSGRELTTCAEVLLGEALALARAEMAGRYGEPENARLSVLGLGTLGGAEMDFESDLDLVFVHDGTGRTSGGTRGSIDAAEWATRTCQRLLNFLTLTTANGVLYRVDSRLRPSGGQGALVTTLDALRDYHLGDGRRGAMLWERQAFLRARPVAGDRSLGDDVTREVLEPLASRPAPADTGAQILEMRRRLDRHPTAAGIDPKRAPGGSLDIQFAVELLELRHGVREPNTMAALARLRDEGAIGAEDAEQLVTAWALLKRLERRLRLAFARPDPYLPSTAPALARVARLVGEAGPDAGERLFDEVERTRARLRRLLERIARDG